MINRVLAIFFLILSNAACVSSSQTDRRTPGAQTDDTAIELKATGVARKITGDKGRVAVTSYNRMVLLTGEVADEKMKAEVQKQVETISGVKSIENDLVIAPVSSVGVRANDAQITGKVKTAIIDTYDIYVNTFKVLTDRSVVYLMGRVTEREAKLAGEVARNADRTISKVVLLFEYIDADEAEKHIPKQAGSTNQVGIRVEPQQVERPNPDEEKRQKEQQAAAELESQRQQLAEERRRIDEEKRKQEQQAAAELESQRQQLAEERRRIEEEKRQQQAEKNIPNKQPAVNDSRRRLALVIGNATYKNSPLRNPTNDADLISGALSSSGFIVSRYDNLTYAKMREVVRAFGEKLNRGDVGLFYFSGHAVQYRGKNYLLPINEDLKHADEIPSTAMDIDFVLAKMETAKNDLNIVILDACRTNPLGSETRNLDRGLTTISAAKGTFIAFATSPGNVALDGSGSNSPYTKNLAQAIRKGGLTLEQVFKETRSNVISETNSQQVPWENSSILGDFYFR
jgi:osmotically-inducible protein OsmY